MQGEKKMMSKEIRVWEITKDSGRVEFTLIRVE